MTTYPIRQPRRLRAERGLRDLCGINLPPLNKMIWPVFVCEGQKQREPISSLPGQFRVSVDMLAAELEQTVQNGLGGILIFGDIDDSKKDDEATHAWRQDGLVQKAVVEARRQFPELPVFTDVCLCGYTTHGHCAPLQEDGRIDNGRGNEILGRIAVSHAAAGSHGVAPSAMMDGQVTAIRRALAEHELDETIIMSYSTKFASSLYEPFRDAAGSAPLQGDRRTYQASYSDAAQAVLESQLDEQEGADILMVKPALFYLDIIAAVKEQTRQPLAVYNVSGEYALLHAAAETGRGELYAMAHESLTALFRAGADIIITYWANQYNQLREM